MAREGGVQRFIWAMIVQLVGIIGYATFVMILFGPTGISRVGGVAVPFVHCASDPGE